MFNVSDKTSGDGMDDLLVSTTPTFNVSTEWTDTDMFSASPLMETSTEVGMNPTDTDIVSHKITDSNMKLLPTTLKIIPKKTTELAFGIHTTEHTGKSELYQSIQVQHPSSKQQVMIWLMQLNIIMTRPRNQK